MTAFLVQRLVLIALLIVAIGAVIREMRALWRDP